LQLIIDRRGEMNSHRLIIILAIVVSLATLPLIALAAPHSQKNWLKNPGFEEGFSERGAPEVVVANHWNPWWISGSPEETGQGYKYRPEYKPEDAQIFGMKRVRSGRYAQKYFNSFATHIAGIQQQVSVPRGSRVTFSIWVQVWSTGQDDINKCDEFGNYAVSVGIDPTGGVEGWSPNIVWSEPVLSCNEWVHLSVSTVAKASVITVFTRGAPEYRVTHNDSYWDDASLTVVVPPTPTPKPKPTNTPTPVPPTPTPAPPTPTPTPTETPTPVVTPTPTVTPTPLTGSICVLAYKDLDGNGIRGPEEELLANAIFTLADSRHVIATYTTDGVSEPFCFTDLAPGNYFVSEQNPLGYASTTYDNWAVALLGGTVMEIEFGDYLLRTPVPLAPSATPTPTEMPSPTPIASLSTKGSAIYNASGVIVLALAVGILVSFNILRRSRRS
jgi:hypothetical protein